MNRGGSGRRRRAAAFNEQHGLRDDDVNNFFNHAAAVSLMLTVFVGTACKRDAPRAASSGIAPTKTLSSLSQEERSRLCDWEAPWAGGYGKVHPCSTDSAVGWNESRSECETSLQEQYGSCSATVAEFERCRRDIWSDPCRGGVLDRPTCAAMNPCVKAALAAEVRRRKALKP
jgi:hypothetical protein